MRVTRRPHPKIESAANTASSSSSSSSSTTNSATNNNVPTELKSPINLPSQTFESLDSQQQQQQKSSTRVWRLKKYKNDDAEQQSTMVQNNVHDSFDDPRKSTTLTMTKKGTRRLPPRRPKTDKNGNPLEFVFVDASPQQESSSNLSDHHSIETTTAKKPGKFPKNIFRLSSGSKKTESHISPTPPPLPSRLENLLSQYYPSVSPTLTLSSSLQDLTRARNPSISSIGRSPLKRTYTSLLQQSRLPKNDQDTMGKSRSRSSSIASMLCIKIDDNGRAAVIQQQQQQQQQQQPTLTKTMSSSSSVSELSSIRAGMLLNSSRSRSPPLNSIVSESASPVLQPALGSNSTSTTPYSLSATDDEDEVERVINQSYNDDEEEELPDNDALVAFTKLIGPKRKQLSRKSSTISINSNFNNLTLTNGITPTSSPVLTRPLHQRTLSSLSQTASSTRRHSPVRSNSRRLHHSQSVSYIGQSAPVLSSQSYDSNYYQSGIHNNNNNSNNFNNNNKPQQSHFQPQQFQPQVRQSTLQNNGYHPLLSSASLYNLNSDSDNNSRHNSNDSSSFEFTGSLGPSLDLSTSFTTGSVSSIATPTSPENPRHDYQSHHLHYQLQLQKQQLQQQLQQQSINPYKTLHSTENSHIVMNSLKSLEMDRNDSARTVTSDFQNQISLHQQQQSYNAKQSQSPPQSQQQQQQHHHHQHQQQQQSGNMIIDEFSNSLMFNDSILSSYNGDTRDENNFDLFDFIKYENTR